MPQAEAATDKVLGERVEQAFVGGRIGDAEVVDGLDNSPPEVALPDPVDDGSGKERISRRRHPGRQLRPDIFTRRLVLEIACKISGLDPLFRPRMNHFSGIAEIDVAL